MLRKIILVLFVVAALAISFGCPPPPPPADSDGDGVADSVDNCPDLANADQLDSDSDDAGDVCDECALDPDNDIDGDGVCGDVDNCPVLANPDQEADADCDTVLDGDDNCVDVVNEGQEDADGDLVGDACDPCTDVDGDGLGIEGDDCELDPCPDDYDNGCLPDPPAIIDGDPLGVASGCAAYVGDHPVVPGTGNIQTYEFCADGSATKWWNPDPIDSPALPGDLTCLGTWTMTDNQLFINTDANMLGMVMNSTETYEIGYTTDGGAQLDFFSAGQDTPGDGSTIEGTYSLHTEVTVLVLGMMDMLTVADTVTTVDADGNWEAVQTSVATCVGGICTPAMNGTTVTTTSGSIALPGELIDVDGTYVLQVDDSLVLDLQP